MQSSPSSELSPELPLEVLLEQARAIKNACIGNKLQKRACLDSHKLERLVQLVGLTEHDQVIVQAAAAIASLAYGPSSDQLVARLQECDAVGVLWRCSTTGSQPASLGCVKAVRMILDCHPGLCSALSSQDCLEQAMAPVLRDPVGPLHAELVLVVGHCAGPHWAAMGAGVVHRLVQLLDPRLTSCSRTQEAAVTALSKLSRGHSVVGTAMSTPHTTALLWHASSSARAESRLSAVCCLAHLAVQQGRELAAAPSEGAPSRVLGVLLSFLEHHSAALKSDALFAAALLFQHLPELQQDACTVSAVMRIAAVMTECAPGHPGPRLLQAALTATGALCRGSEEARQLLLRAKMLPGLLAATEHPEHTVRAAACGVLQGLSRSVRTLRTAMLDQSLAPPVMRLLQDKEPPVQVAALAVLCNLVLDFSPLRQVLLECGVLPQAVLLLGAEHPGAVRVQAGHLLHNLSYKADQPTKHALMSHLGGAGLLGLLHEHALAEQALLLLRNLVSGHEEHVAAVLAWAPPEVLLSVQNHLEGSEPALVKQALYVVCNIASGSSEHKLQLMSRQAMMLGVVSLIGSRCPEVRLAAVWCIINLTWPHETGVSERVAQLMAMGCHSRLQKLLLDSDHNMQDRVQLALSQFNSSAAAEGEGEEANNTVDQEPAAMISVQREL